MDKTDQWVEGLVQGTPTDDSLQEQPEEYSENFVQLSQLGYLSDLVSWCGHQFQIKTLNTKEEIAASKLVRQYDDTLAQYKATLTSIVAASLISINGIPFLPYLGDVEFEAHIEQRFNRVTDWFWPAIDFLAKEQAKLTERATKELEELEKKFSGSRRVLSDT